MDIEAALMRLLAEETGWEWFGVKPSGIDRCGTVERTGGGVSDCIDSPMVALQVWGDTRTDACRMAMLTASAVPRLVNRDGIRSAKVESVYNLPDYEGNRPRYQITAVFKTVAAR